MVSITKFHGLYVITDHENLDFMTLHRKTEEILARGIFALQYRDKSGDNTRRLERASQLQKLCITYDTLFIVNDDIDMAQQLGSDGIHLGKDDIACKIARARLGNDKIIGVSCYNNLQRVEQAVMDGADYIALGAMFPTNSKMNTEKATPDLITTAKQKNNIAVAAIGGITPENCLPLIEAGADMLAIISSVYRAQDPGAVIDKFNYMMSKK
jgi:thiamine-phosphate pyrophosphorylase